MHLDMNFTLMNLKQIKDFNTKLQTMKHTGKNLSMLAIEKDLLDRIKKR